MKFTFPSRSGYNLSSRWSRRGIIGEILSFSGLPTQMTTHAFPYVCEIRALHHFQPLRASLIGCRMPPSLILFHFWLVFVHVRALLIIPWPASNLLSPWHLGVPDLPSLLLHNHWSPFLMRALISSSSESETLSNPNQTLSPL